MDGLTVGVMQYSRWVGWWEGRTEEGFEVDDEDWEAVYFHSIFVDAREVGMETSQWIARCALRLREEWPRPAGADLAEAAAELWEQNRWREMEPEVAAAAWLRLGIPSVESA